MNWINDLHPLPRYGLAAALVRLGKDEEAFDYSSEEELLALAASALQDSLSAILMRAEIVSDRENAYVYKSILEEDLDPGKQSGQISANGVFIEPHVTSSNNAADIVKEIRQIIRAIKEKANPKPYELKRSFSPVIAKFNGGKKSMSNPKVSLLEAALTAIGTATRLKPAAFNFEDSVNVGFLPDLPFYDHTSDEYPLVLFVRLFQAIQSQGLGEGAYLGSFDPKEKRFKRPPIFQGNYPKAPRTFGFGAVSVLAALGNWLKEYQDTFDISHQQALVLSYFSGQTVYILSYAGTSQESFDHHLVSMARSGYLHELTSMAWRTRIPNVEERTKLSDPKWKNYIRSLDQFLRFFHTPAWKNFLAQRAYYPAEFAHLFKTYFMEKKHISEAVVHSAMQYGKSLNRAAYSAAVHQMEDDQKAGRKNAPSLEEYKNRTLTQFETTIRSAKSATAMLAQMATIVGRLSMRDIHSDGGLFMEEVAKGSLDQETARDLIIAFMRLGTYKKKTEETDHEERVGTGQE